MTASRVIVFVAAVASLAKADIPEGYVFEVEPSCGADAIENARIHIVTDLNAVAVAQCADDSNVDFTTSDQVNFYLDVSYPNQGELPCVFKKRKHSLVFAILVLFSYGEEGSALHQTEEEVTVTCTFSPKGDDESADNNVLEGLIAPKEIAAHMAPENTFSTFTVEMVDVTGGSLNNNVALGRTIRLRGSTLAEGGEVGIRPVSCWAIEGDARYAIIRAGCGDGIIFAKDKGFTTIGTESFSPYFQAFSINAGAVIKFSCDFVTCAVNCDGSSCENEFPVTATTTRSTVADI